MLNDILDMGGLKDYISLMLLEKYQGQEAPWSAVCKLENQESQWYNLVWVPRSENGGEEGVMV